MTAPATTELSNFLKEAMIRLPGFSPETVQIETGAALREFCARSLAWQTTTSATVVAGNPDAALTLAETGATPVLLRRATLAGGDSPLSGVMPPYGSDLLLSGATQGPPRHCILVSPFLARVFPRPNADYTLTLELAVTATDANAALPVGFWIVHRDALLTGLLARLHAMPGTPASSEKLAVFYQKQFRAECARARIYADRGFHQAFAPAMPFPRPPGVRRGR